MACARKKGLCVMSRDFSTDKKASRNLTLFLFTAFTHNRFLTGTEVLTLGYKTFLSLWIFFVSLKLVSLLILLKNRYH